MFPPPALIISLTNSFRYATVSLSMKSLFTHLFWIGLFGFFGSLSRFLLSKGIGRLVWAFPLGTFVVNVIGSLILGFMMYSVLAGKEISPLVRDAIGIGFLGAFTTMSTFSFETFRLLEQGEMVFAFINIIINVGACLFAIYIGKTIAYLAIG